MLDNPIRRLLHNPSRILAGLVEEGQTVVDLGCGPGVFSLPMAHMVGESGRVFAVDLQAEMLELVRVKAERQGMLKRVTLHQSSFQSIGLQGPVDFVLAFWMVHEVGNQETFLDEIEKMIRPGGRFLLVEPVMHVSQADFDKTTAKVRGTGMAIAEIRKVRISRAVLFQKPSGLPAGR
jgi:ubiquinone/menaquinone biosynthesis C-methylase UbiE